MVNNFLANKLIRDCRIDLVHIQQASSTLFLPLLGTRGRPRVLYTLHVSYAEEMAQIAPYEVLGRVFRPSFGEIFEKYVNMPVHRMLDWVGLNRADAITAMNDSTKRCLEKKYSVPVSLVPNGCNVPELSFLPPTDPKFTAFAGERVVVACSGSFRTRKRLPLLLMAFRQLIELQTDVTLLILGGGRGYEQAMSDLVTELGLGSNVWFAGQISQAGVLSYLRLSDIFCMVSTLEGMPVALIEAMAMGLPVVGTRIPGIEEIVIDEQTGLLVEVDDAVELASALHRLVDSDTLRNELGSAASAFVERQLNWRDITAKYLAALDLDADRKRAASF
jgi:glycosyltransferase involved in cell wall biosynthesis